MGRWADSPGVQRAGLALLHALDAIVSESGAMLAMRAAMAALRDEPRELELACRLLARVVAGGEGGGSREAILQEGLHAAVVDAMCAHPRERALQAAGAHVLAMLAHRPSACSREQAAVMRRALAEKGAAACLTRLAESYVEDRRVLMLALTGLVNVVGGGRDGVVKERVLGEGRLPGLLVAVVGREEQGSKAATVALALMAGLLFESREAQRALGEAGAAGVVVQERWLADAEVRYVEGHEPP
jgi:hypothetical protein